MKNILAVTTIIILVATLSYFSTNIQAYHPAATYNTSPALLVSGLPDFSNIAEHASPGVVHIRVLKKSEIAVQPSVDIQEFFKRFGIPLPDTPHDENSKIDRGVGSGFIWSKDGLVLTNAHVVKDAHSLEITLNNGDVVQAKVLGADERTDVALLKLDLTHAQKELLQPLTIGTSQHLRVGQWVIAIGSPFGLDKSVTAGIISAKQRETGDFLPLIQTDVAINPGNSGGPLLNLSGEVVGVNSQIYSSTGGFQGISFALPIDEVMLVAKELHSNGSVERGRIGVLIGAVEEDMYKTFGLEPNQPGLILRGVENQGAAAKAGLMPGDIIISWGGQTVGTAAELSRKIAGVTPGTKIPIVILRNKKELTFTIEVASSENKGQVSAKPMLDNTGILNTTLTPYGFTLRVENHDTENISITVDELNESAKRNGLRNGDLLLEINNNKINISTLIEYLTINKPNELRLLVERKGWIHLVIIQRITP